MLLVHKVLLKLLTERLFRRRFGISISLPCLLPLAVEFLLLIGVILFFYP